MHYKRIYNIALFSTSILIFIIWSIIIPVIKTFNIGSVLIENMIRFLISSVFAYGSFHAIVLLIVGLLKRVMFVKRLIFGPSYIEGTWIGYYFAGKNNIPVIFFQIIKQDIDEIHILSQCYHTDKTYRCAYNSIGEVSIEPSSSSFRFLYNVDRIDKKEVHYGMVISKLQFEKRRFSKFPCRITGYSYYLGVHQKQFVVQTKYSDSIFINSKLDYKESKYNFLISSEQTAELIQKALDFYNKEKNITNKKRWTLTAWLSKSL